MGLEQLPNWFTPKLSLFLFCLIAACNYMDRGVIAANAVKRGIGELYGLNNFQYFLLPSVFMVGLLIASPVFAQLTKQSHPLFLIGAGMSVWVVATAGCGLSWSYYALLTFRMLVGVGEASFICLAGPFIEERAPPSAKTTWLAIFYMCIPSGTALGYVVGGAVTDLSGSWRAPFLLESMLMAPFAVMGLVISTRSSTSSTTAAATPCSSGNCNGDVMISEGGVGSHAEEGVGGVRVPLLGSGADGNVAAGGGGRGCRQVSASISFLRGWVLDTSEVFSYRVFSVACVGYVLYTVTTGVLLNAGPTAGASIFPNDFQGAISIDEFFGGVTILTGIVGTAAGGMLLDRICPTMQGAMILSAACAALSSALFILCFNIHDLSTFLVVFVLASLCMFAVSAPVNAAYMWSVPAHLRPLACALVIMAIHVFGDVPSPPLAGLLVDSLQRRGFAESLAWTITMTVGFAGIGLAAIAWAVCAVMAQTEHDYRVKETIDGVSSPDAVAVENTISHQ